MGVHLRRKDFLYARKEEVPSLSDAISQIKVRFSNLSFVEIGPKMLQKYILGRKTAKELYERSWR